MYVTIVSPGHQERIDSPTPFCFNQVKSTFVKIHFPGGSINSSALEVVSLVSSDSCQDATSSCVQCGQSVSAWQSPTSVAGAPAVTACWLQIARGAVLLGLLGSENWQMCSSGGIDTELSKLILSIQFLLVVPVVVSIAFTLVQFTLKLSA